jgi:NAD dependent epimerase/dehydratase family enzyme
MPATLLHGLLGDFADELLLGGQRVLPGKAELSGFKFRHPTLASALAALLGSKESMRAHQLGQQVGSEALTRP